jgi:hypothetical protein
MMYPGAVVNCVTLLREVIQAKRCSLQRLNGDGSFGQNAMELDTAVRHKLPLLCVTSLNGRWIADPEGNKPGRLGRFFRLAPHKPTPLLFAVIPKKYNGGSYLSRRFSRVRKELPAK